MESEERPGSRSGAKPSEAERSRVRRSVRSEPTAGASARSLPRGHSSFRESPFRINLPDVTDPRQETSPGRFYSTAFHVLTAEEK